MLLVTYAMMALQEHLPYILRFYHRFGMSVSHGFLEAGCAAL